MKRVIISISLMAASVVGFALPTIAHAAGLAQPDFANDPWVLALIGLLGIGGVASLVGTFLDGIAQAVGVTTDALLWLLCFGLAIVITLARGGVPVWGGDPDSFLGAVMDLMLVARAGAATVYGLFMVRFKAVRDAAAPAVGKPA